MTWSDWPRDIPTQMGLRLSRHLIASGRVLDSTCGQGRSIRVERRSRAGWVVLRTDVTNNNGYYRVRLPERAGRYRAVAPRLDTPEYRCLRGESQVIRHRH